ncbi:hypothetical protein [Vreelandella stevensii]|uniref:hypothetical protein n=1 Tax=Vreelandella stevensii TaxID=502821 RepID=UPI003747E78F
MNSEQTGHDGTRTVTCVVFQAGGYQVAIDARYVQRIDSHCCQPRHASVDTLLFDRPGDSSRWLTLRDAEGSWQLGIGSESRLARLPVAQLHSLPPLIAARTGMPALCGLMLEQQRLTLLLDGQRLSPSVLQP